MYRTFITLYAGVSVVCFIFFCADPPTNPFSPEHTKISLILKSSTFQESDTAVTDTVGKTIRLALCLYLTQNIDSTVITIGTSPTHIDTVLKCTLKDHTIDTAFYDLVFATPGTRSVSAIAHVGKELRQATAKIHVIARPQPNRKPELAVTGSRTVMAGQACTLKVSASDPDSGQRVTVDTLRSPRGSAFSDTVFIWQTAIAASGTDTIIFIARDNGSPVLADTEVVVITVNPVKINHPPQWNDDTVTISGIVGWPVSLPLADKCSDPDNDTLTFALLAGAPDCDTVQNGVYSFTPAAAHEGTFFPRVIARDSQQLADTLVIKLTISPADTTPPTISRISPPDDSTTISASSYQVRVSATDKSGIRSVRCFKAADSISVTRSDTVYTATVTGILQNQYTKVTFIAIDFSRNANACTLSVYISRDSTMLDSEGPVIIQKSGPQSGSVITDSIIAITDSILDPSGIDSVYWTLNSTYAGTMTPVSGSTTNYTLRDTLSKYRSNRIVIHAIDRSSRRNRDSTVVVLDYNLPPIINYTAVATDRNTAKIWTLSAQSRDNDSLSWSRLTSPSPLSGTVTGTLPSITFIPASNWSGTDSFYVRVTDGYWSDTAKIKVTVVDVPVAPRIVTQPQGLTRVLGQSAAFSVIINSDVNPAPTFLWKRNGTAISGANAASFSIGSVAIEDSGSYTVTVSNSAGTVTSNPALLTVQYAPVITAQPQSQTLYLGQPVTFSVAAQGYPAPTYQWEKNGSVISGQTSASFTIASPGVSDSGRYTVSVMNTFDTLSSDTVRFYARIKSVSAGISHSLIVKTDGTLWGMGSNSSGELGDGTRTDHLFPHQIMTGVLDVSAGHNYSMILKTDSTLWGTGYNASGQLGDGTNANRTTPVLVTNGVKAVSAFNMHTLILKTDGTLWATGANFGGQLGDSTTTDRNTPGWLAGGVIAASAGGAHTMFIKSDGTLWGAGYNNHGQLGDGTTDDKKIPFQVTRAVSSVAAGDAYTMILKNDGTILAAGYNCSGQLGDGTTLDRLVPLEIMSNVAAVRASYEHSMAVKRDGTLWVMGSNEIGALGDSSTTDRLTPVRIQINGLNEGVMACAAGEYHSLVISTSGMLLATGDNRFGQLGDGTTTASLAYKIVMR